MAYCSKCGQQLRDTDKFCPNCGTAINTEFVAEEPKKKGGIPWWGIVLIIIGSLVFLYILLTLVLGVIMASKEPTYYEPYYSWDFEADYDYTDVVDEMTDGIEDATNLVTTARQFKDYDDYESPMISVYEDDIRDNQIEVAKEMSEFKRNVTDTDKIYVIDNLYKDYQEILNIALNYRDDIDDDFDNVIKSFNKNYQEFINTIQ